jgi:Icc-related predicted phosphoesterase
MRCRVKVLLASDLHYSLRQLDWIHGVAPEFDVVVLAGDHLDISSLVAVDAQVVVVLKYLRRLKERSRLIVCSGNHDLDARSPAGERVARWMAKVRDLGVPADGDFLEIGDVTITVCPWWDGPAACAEVGAQLARDAARRGRRWVWVYHAPPDGSPVSWAGSRHFGDAELLGWIRTYAPDVVLAGHIHQAPFREGGSWVDRIGSTWVFNAGRQIGPCPTHVVVDLDARSARWSSLAGNESVSLEAPVPARAPL